MACLRAQLRLWRIANRLTLPLVARQYAGGNGLTRQFHFNYNPIHTGITGPRVISSRWLCSNGKAESTGSENIDSQTTTSQDANTPQVDADQENIVEESSTVNEHMTVDSEKIIGKGDTHEFQAETRQLLDIVARSLYSEREVFIREVISNASDALEKLRHLQVTGEKIIDEELPLEIRISTDSVKKTFTIQDTGVGMTKEEMIQNLGTIARSGSKAFMQQHGSDNSNNIATSIIGQFGVGFYSTFMVADSVEVYSRSVLQDSPSYHWTSDGTGKYKIAEAEGVQRGTKIIIRLKDDATDFSSNNIVQDLIKKYSNFVGSPIYLDGECANTVEALWTKRANDISDQEHQDFYRFIAGGFDTPLYKLHYTTDAPLSIRSLFYVPDDIPGMYLQGISRIDSGVSLFSRRVLIQAKCKEILPEWLRFLRGVVDSEDIPLNLSRELLQDNALIRKLSNVLTSRILRFFAEEAKRDRVKFENFFQKYGLFFREGLVSADDSSTKEDIAKLFSFESSLQEPGKLTNLTAYIDRMPPGRKHIYYLCVPNRAAAESSPYYEALKKKNVEILFAYHTHDDIVLESLHQFKGKNIISAENFRVTEETESDRLPNEDVAKLIDWIKTALGKEKVFEVKSTDNLTTHPAMVSVPDMAIVRRLLKTTEINIPRSQFLKSTLEINPKHEIMHKLAKLHPENPKLATLIIEQIFDNAMITAGLGEDPRPMRVSIKNVVPNFYRDLEGSCFLEFFSNERFGAKLILHDSSNCLFALKELVIASLL
ncbi:Heat shock protein 75 kDa, mitochondrial [Trichoplax sp. H2]|nr:Heat shock protein 75 kDa, mitochondrial [Trichoplax sp. H2]|eukprot:RDD39233.1 Heat shock protein 75 kDa, mitochondrial [Trichoplax sp. H2]